MTNNSNWERLERVIEWARMNTNQFARHIGLARAESLYQIKFGKNQISLRLAQRINEQFPQVRVDWLLTGRGCMLAEEVGESIPLYSAIEHIGDREAVPERMLAVPLFKECCCAYRNSDGTMAGEVAVGEVLFLAQTDIETIVSGESYVVDCGNLVVLRRVWLEENGTIRLENDGATMVIEQTSVKAAYRIVGRLVVNKN